MPPSMSIDYDDFFIFQQEHFQPRLRYHYSVTSFRRFFLSARRTLYHGNFGRLGPLYFSISATTRRKHDSLWFRQGSLAVCAALV